MNGEFLSIETAEKIARLQKENKKLKENMDETLIQMLYKRKKELEQINEEHRRINGELRKTINEAIEYIKEDMYGEPNELYGLVDGEHLLNILQGSDE